MPYSGQAKPGSISKANEDEVNAENTSLENVRTLASTEYFDDWSGHGAWPIVLSNRAYGDLRQLQRRDGHSCRMVGKKIKELSQGFFSNDNQKRLKGFKAEVPIYEAKVSRDLRIVYQIDIDTDVKRQSVRQIIKIYGVYTHAQMDNRLWSLVSRYHALRHGKEYRDQCSARDTARTPGNNVTLPVEFSLPEESESTKEQQSNVNSSIDYAMNDDDLSAVRSTVVFEKFMLMSKDLVKSIVEDLDGAHVFQVSPKEKEVIYHDSASFVLGRSGTGKTTCIVFKMLGVERRFEEGDEAKPRQIFITQSPALAKKVQEYYCSLIKTYSHRPALRNHNIREDKGILSDFRDESVESLGLPSRYSLLEDQHFPLFLSFDQFCTLLEEDYIFKFGHSARARRFDPGFMDEIDEEFKSDPEYFYEKLLPAVQTMERIKNNKHASMTFEIFAFAHWPHFSQSLTSGLDPALVYNEIIGVIEGSEGTLNSESGVLSRDEYLGLGRGNSLLSSRREDIYTLYESYCRAGGQLNDAAERTHALLIATRDGKHIPGPKVDALYIDEVQDNLLIDNKLLFNFCNNPHGVLMAGDTAQTISAGSSFRFEDLKAFFWRLENQDKAVRAKKRKLIQPVLFHLSVNYRSHGGIVDCASTLVELVSQLFPDSIDKLQRETGLIEGPKPILFSGWEHGSIQIDRFLRDQGDIPIDFGANQVILVRSNAAREALRTQVGEIGLILTLYESKGLEFNDVLLYNFFEDSVASATTWRIILHGLKRSKFRSLPPFDTVRHAIICSELKNLYVGITRARGHCWIWDISERALPMKEYWTERNLIEQCGPGDPIPQLSALSSESEWEAQGRTLFERELYPQAMLCFRKAGLTLEHDIAAAYEARKQARLLQAAKSSNRESQTAFCQVAEMFLECGKNATSRQQDSCHLRAADCYLQAEEWKLAAKTFIVAREFGLAAKNFRRAGCFADAVNTIKTYQAAIPESIVEEIRKVARLEYLRTDQYDQAKELFSDLEEQLDYMEVCGLESGRIHVLEQHQRHEAAAEAAAEAEFDKGNILEGIHLLKSSNDAKLLHRAVEKALDGLWLLYPLRCQLDVMDNPAADELIQCLLDLSKILTEEETHQFEVFRAIHAGDLTRIRSLAQSHGTLTSGPLYLPILSLLCFPRNSNSLIPSTGCTLKDFINTAKLTWKYVSQLFLFTRFLDMSKLSTQRLLGVEALEHSFLLVEAGEDAIVSPGFRIYSNSLLFDCLQSPELSSQVLSVTKHALNLTVLTASESDTRELASNALYSMLRSEIFKVHEAASSGFQALYPCLDFAVFGNCKRSGCRKQQVNSLRTPESERQVLFNLRAQALIIQIEIADKYYVNTHAQETVRRKIRRVWAHKMYEALMPLFPPLGGLHSLDSAFIPELGTGKGVISVWSHQALFELDPRYGAEDRFLSDALAFLDLAFHFDPGFSAYVGSLHSSRIVKTRRDLMTNKPRFPFDRFSHSIMHDFVNFYRRKSDDAIRRVIQATNYVVSNNLAIEANLLVHLLEFIAREIIVHHRACHRGKSGVFDGLIVPQSWALHLANRRPLTAQRGCGGTELMEYLDTLYRTLENLRKYTLQPSYLYSFSGKGTLNLLGRGILILRICRIIVLVAKNASFTHSMRVNARANISRTLTGPGDVHHPLCHRVIRTTSWADLEGTIMRCPLNRGAEQLVHLFLKSNRYPQPRSSDLVRVVVYGNISELSSMLSFTNLSQQPRPAPNPQVHSFNPSQPNQSSPAGQTSAPDIGKDLKSAQGDTMDLMRSDSESTQFDGSIQPKSHSNLMRTLNTKEIDSGKRILFAYRQYVLRNETRQRSAVEIICRCYSRYLCRRNTPRSATDERYLKFQREYEKDIGMPEGSGHSLKSFYRYKATLLGCMPHVAVYLRGLEYTNQQQKHANRKRLKTADHKELEEIQARMDACSKFTMGLKKLVPALMPGSKELRNLHALQTHVKELAFIYREMEEDFGRDTMPAFLEHHRQWGVAIILAQSF